MSTAPTDSPASSRPRIRSLNALTLLTASMAESVAFHSVIGGPVVFGGPEADFTTLRFGPDQFLNLQLEPHRPAHQPIWGRFIVFVDDVDAAHERFRAHGHRPEMDPTDAPWGERYFHIRDPDGHQMSVATPLRAR